MKANEIAKAILTASNDMARFALNSDFIICVGGALIVLCLSGACTIVDGQSTIGFLSIDCGYNNLSYVDNSTTLKWVNDGDYTLTGTNGELDFAVKSNVDNYQALQTFRYFPETQSKYCYDLPNQANGSFLLRAMFLHGNSSLLDLPAVFNVYVGNTKWISVQYFSNDDIETLTTTKGFESIFYSSVKTVHVCLVPLTGVPFISSLELRPFVLNNDSFLYQTPYQYRWSVLRWNTGAAPGARTQRYPDDKFDRLWTVPDYSVDSFIPDFTNPTIYNSYGTLTNVLRDAWMNDSPNSSFASKPYSISYDGLQDRSLGEGTAYLYYWEISPNASASRVRDMNVSVHNVSYAVRVNQTVLIQGIPVSSLKQTLDFSFTAQPQSTLGPILNGIVVYALFDFDNSSTASIDLVALQGLQANFNLTDWQGDPCLPVAWDWVNCEYHSNNFTARVNKLLLSSRSINGSIPSSILQMDALTEIHLDNNSLSGPIPDSLADLRFLTFLSLNNNNLSGEVPAGLLNKTSNFYFTYFGNSLLAVGLSQTSKKKSRTNFGVVGGSIAAALLGLLLMSILTWYVFFGRRKRASGFEKSPGEHEKSHPRGPSAGHVSLEMILVATNNYAKKIGTGSFGSVYHGVLHGKEVAVKMNNMNSDLVQRNHEFINEVDILTRVHHKNLVNLIGYCNEGEQLILIYEYQSNGTLREWLRDKNKNLNDPQRKFLDWPKRLQIAVNAAKGLEYLHKDCTPSIIHRDVKSNNILLDEDLVGKVADFGISKTALDSGPDLYDEVHTAVRGTFGYLDPEYEETSILTQKSDVYSFGVVLAELISGRAPWRISEDGSTHDFLVDELPGFVAKADLRLVADPRLEGDYDVESMWRVADIALTCLRRTGNERPDMTSVMRNLAMTQSRARERREQSHSLSLADAQNKQHNV